MVSFFRDYDIYKVLCLLRVIYFNKLSWKLSFLQSQTKACFCYIKISHDYAVMDLPRLLKQMRRTVPCKSNNLSLICLN